MNSQSILIAAALSGLVPTAVVSAADEVNNGWDARWFAYEASKPTVAQGTPTAAQVDWRQRPPQVRRAAELKPTAEPAEPRRVGDVDIVHLRYIDADGDVVPALLCTPAGKAGPFPVVVAVHGLTSNKAQVCAQLAPEMTKRGFAVLAPDMPRHGERPGDPRSVVDQQRPLEMFKVWRRAVVDVRQAIDVAATLPQLDVSRGVTLAGYSMGSWINSVTGAADGRVTSMVLMVGGAHDIPPAALMIPQIAACDPRLALAHFAGRPLLMLNARQDYTVTPDMGERLFAAAAEPKEQRWFDCGHHLCDDAYAAAAEWVAAQAARRTSVDPSVSRRAGAPG